MTRDYKAEKQSFSSVRAQIPRMSCVCMMATGDVVLCFYPKQCVMTFVDLNCIA
jgi:hypothetical protein